MELPAAVEVPVKRASVLRVLLLGMALVMLGLSPEQVLASGAHGGGGGGFHGGGGGFHGGGGFGGGGYHGGSFGGMHASSGYGGYHGGGWGGNAWHGGGWNGYHGGWGYRGGYWNGGWGCCGWGFGVSFNFGWPGWGWGYPVYSPGYAYYPYPYYAYPPYQYPYYYYVPVGAPAGYTDPGPNAQVGVSYAAPATYTPADSEYEDPAPSAPPADSPTPAPSSPNSYRLYQANYVPRPPATATSSVPNSARAYQGSVRTSSASLSTTSYHPASNVRQLPPVRPEVQNVIRALLAMPPAAAQRALASGQYGNLSPSELQLARAAAGLPVTDASSR